MEAGNKNRSVCSAAKHTDQDEKITTLFFGEIFEVECSGTGKNYDKKKSNEIIFFILVSLALSENRNLFLFFCPTFHFSICIRKTKPSIRSRKHSKFFIFGKNKKNDKRFLPFSHLQTLYKYSFFRAAKFCDGKWAGEFCCLKKLHWQIFGEIFERNGNGWGKNYVKDLDYFSDKKQRKEMAGTDFFRKI